MKSRRCTFALLLTALTTLCASAATPSPDELGLIPMPRSVSVLDGTYSLPHTWTLVANTNAEREAAAFALSYARERGGDARIAASGGNLTFAIVRGAGIEPEGYRLRVNAEGVLIQAATGGGLFYGLQTFEQIVDTRGTLVPFLVIDDAPRFAWRGIHLDVSRHFFSVPVVKRYIDIAAHYKLNTFHWHLTDDQGWRIAIRRYPRLTAVGSCRAQTMIDHDATEFDGKRYCGYYTQAQVRDVVAYARMRHVTIVPEIEMPGHAEASVAAYPWLACGSPRVEVRETWGVSHEIYCPTEASFRFLSNVLAEVVELFPGRYVHVGGDEVPKDEWEHSVYVHRLMVREHLKTYDAVQGYFDRRIERILARYGRRMIGWDEILDGGVTKTATVMSWRGEAGGIKGANRGNDVVMTPDGPLYFDAYQGDQNDEPDAIGGLSRLQDVYAYRVVPAQLQAAAARHIIGVQGNVWSEYIADPSYLFYMLLPREQALSEIAWSQPETRNWASFEDRMVPQYAWMTRHNFTFRIPNPEFSLAGATVEQFDNVAPSMRTTSVLAAGDGVTVSIREPVPDCAIHYTTDGSPPNAKSPVYLQAWHLSLAPGDRHDISAMCVLPDGRASTPTELIVER
ncbi:MAG: family 20 glycosylhydrolase [Candidatus Baltobacteraceae bacterium]